RAFDALYGRIYNFIYASNVLVVNRVALGLADLLEDDLFRKLRGNAPENSFCFFWDHELATYFGVRIGLTRVINRDLQVRVLDLLRSFDNALYSESADFAGIFVELRAQVLLRLVVLARGNNNGVFHRADYNLRINSFFPAQGVNCVVKLACHKKPSF